MKGKKLNEEPSSKALILRINSVTISSPSCRSKLLSKAYRQRTTQELQILTMYEHPENDQGQQTRGRRGVRIRGGRVQRQNRGRSRGGQGQRRISDEIRATIVDHVVNHGLQWLKGEAKYWETDYIFNNSNILKQSLSINIPHTVMCKCVLLKG